MRYLATILIVLTLLGAISAPMARAESIEEVVLIGRGDLLAQNVPAPQIVQAARRVTRIERFAQPAPLAITDPTLGALDDQQAPLLEAIPSVQPVLEHLVVPSRQIGAKQTVLGGLPQQDSEPFEAEGLLSSTFDSEYLFESQLSTTVSMVLLVITMVALRRWILAAVNRAVLWLVVAVNHRGAKVVSPDHRKRRRRSSSRRRTPDVSWYFRKACESSGSRSRGRSRRRWSTAPRPREYVVTDVVYATAPVQPAPRYLLTNSLN